jgi:spermidine/putrescine transport system permease protein
VSFFTRKPIAPLDYNKRLWMRSWIGGVTFFLYAPLMVLFVFSFNDSKANVVWRGFTFKYYGKVFKNESLMEALGNR